MSRHVPLYRALLALVRGIAVTPVLTPLLVKNTSAPDNLPADSIEKDRSQVSSDLPALLNKMNTTVNNYMAKLKWKPHKTTNESKQSSNKMNTPTSSLLANTLGSVTSVGNCNSINPDTIVNDDAESEEGLTLLVPDIQLSTLVVQVSRILFAKYVNMILICS